MRTASISLLLAGCCLWAQELTPRQLFYKEDAGARPAEPPKSAAKASKKAAPKPAPAPSTPKPESGAASPAPAPVAAPADIPPPPSPARATAAVYNAAMTDQRPLGLRYALVQVANGGETEVNPGGTFHSGDMVRVKMEGNREGFLYVITRGSSGNWRPLFPSPEINAGENRVAPHQRYRLPSSTQAFTFDDQPGQEQLFVIFSAEPIRDMESMIPSLLPPTDQRSRPPAMVTASAAPITDGFVSQLRKTYSRDLIVQTVTPKAPDAQTGDAMENAVYVVSKSGGRVVADIRLEHR
jgi:hypothetical protein